MEKQFGIHSRRATVKLIILDRDGVINQDRDDFVKSVDEWIPIEGSMDAIAFLTQAGYNIAVATNQSGIGRKYFTVQDLTEMHAKMHRLAVQAGMIYDILERFKADPAETWLVGDSLRDLQAMHEAGGKTALVMTGKGKKTLSQQEKELPENTQIFDSLLAFSQYIMHEAAQDRADGQANP